MSWPLPAVRALSLLSLGAVSLGATFSASAASSDGAPRLLWSHSSGAGVYALAVGPGYLARARGGEIVLFRDNPVSIGHEEVLASIATPVFLWDLKIVGKTLYATGNGGSGEGVLFSMDVSQPATPGPLHILDRTPATGRSIAVAGTRLYVAAGRAGVFAYELHASNPAIARRIGAFAAPDGSYFQGVAARAEDPFHVYVADRGMPSAQSGGRRVLMLDAQDASSIHPVAQAAATDPRDIAVTSDGGFALLCDGPAGLRVFKASNLEAVALFSIGQLLGSVNDVRAHRITTQGSTALIAIQGRNSDRMPPFDPESAGSSYYVRELQLATSGGDGGVAVLDWSATGTPETSTIASVSAGRPVRALAAGFGSLVIAQTDIGSRILEFGLSGLGAASVPTFTIDNTKSTLSGSIASGNPFGIAKFSGFVSGVADGGEPFVVDFVSKKGNPQVTGGRGGMTTIPWNKAPNGQPKAGVDLIVEGGVNTTGFEISYFDHSAPNPAPPKLVAALQVPGSGNVWNAAFRPRGGPVTDDLLVFSVGGFLPQAGPGYYRMSDLGPALQGAIQQVIVQGHAPVTLSPDVGSGGIPVVFRDITEPGLLPAGFFPETLWVTADDAGRGWLSVFLRADAPMGPVERTALLAFPLTKAPNEILPLKILETNGVAYSRAEVISAQGATLLFASDFMENVALNKGGGVDVYRVAPAGPALENVTLTMLKRWSAPINLEGVPECVLTAHPGPTSFTAACFREGAASVPYTFNATTNALTFGPPAIYNTTGIAEEVVADGARLTVADHLGGLHVLDPEAPAFLVHGWPGATGVVPRIGTIDVPVPGAKGFAVTIDEATGGELAFLIASTGCQNTSQGWNSWLEPGNAIFAGAMIVDGPTTPGEGHGAVRLPLLDSLPADATVFFQWFVFPASMSGPISSTDVLRLQIVDPF